MANKLIETREIENDANNWFSQMQHQFAHQSPFANKSRVCTSAENLPGMRQCNEDASISDDNVSLSPRSLLVLWWSEADLSFLDTAQSSLHLYVEDIGWPGKII